MYNTQVKMEKNFLSVKMSKRLWMVFENDYHYYVWGPEKRREINLPDGQKLIQMSGEDLVKLLGEKK